MVTMPTDKTDKQKAWVTSEQAARKLGITGVQVRRLVDQGRLAGTKKLRTQPGARNEQYSYFVDVADLERFKREMEARG